MSHTIAPLYAACYCEENIWQLLHTPPFEHTPSRAIFISNPARQCALWNQRAAAADGEPVIWDYHVVAARLEPGRPCEIWDLDSRAGYPLPLEAWWAATFPIMDRVHPKYHPRFRVILAKDYHAIFSSDRSHMRTPQGSWLAAPPGWPAIWQGHDTLQDLISMERGEGCGEVMGAGELLRAMS